MSEEIAESNGLIREIQRLRGLLALAEADVAAAWAQAGSDRADLNQALIEIDRLQPIASAAAKLDATIRGDGNGRCWCSAHEADMLRSALEKARLE